MACPSSSPREPRVLEKLDLVRTWQTDSTPWSHNALHQFHTGNGLHVTPRLPREIKGQPRLLPSLSLNEGG